ncbi:hypothetical protein OIE68_36885 [Nocardia vinacea]|uniref:hypothetical protein n=1 Tax=Nocardia vinacea TaxID=96468 RepID=UPI002E1231AF|nr:hypothetical protein OIE68_36885 [Nocardia vinacea]
MRPGLEEVRDKQFGVFTSWQVLCEYTRAEMRTLLDRGEWVRVFRGVFREVTTPPSARLRVEAARLSMGVPSLTAAYDTAAELHGFAVQHNHPTHVLGPQDSRIGRLIVHRDHVDQAELDLIQGTITTNAARTAIDVARTLSRPDALATLNAALRRGVPRSALTLELQRHHRRRGHSQAAELLDLARARPRSTARLHCPNTSPPVLEQ